MIAEIAELAEQGVKEVTLLGQNVNAYRGRHARWMHLPTLRLLIEYVAALDGIERIRFTTSHPLEFSDRLIRTFRRGAEAGQLPASAGAERL